ncbi:MAG: hypothetical protein ACRDGU_01360 [Actinomycetota bacterium]
MSSKGAADPAGGIGSTRDAMSIDLAEFQKLRDEITGRMQLQTTIVGAQLAVLGTGLSLLTTSPEILLGLAAISSFLWLLWLDHAEQVHKIGLYVGSVLAPRLGRVGPGALGWERFLRDLDRGHPEGRRVGNYVAVLFGGSSAFLSITYGARMLDVSDGTTWPFLGRLIGLLLVLSLLVVAASRHRLYVRLAHEVSGRLLAPEEAAFDAATEGGQPVPGGQSP